MMTFSDSMGKWPLTPAVDHRVSWTRPEFSTGLFRKGIWGLIESERLFPTEVQNVSFEHCELWELSDRKGRLIDLRRRFFFLCLLNKIKLSLSMEQRALGPVQ